MFESLLPIPVLGCKNMSFARFEVFAAVKLRFFFLSLQIQHKFFGFHVFASKGELAQYPSCVEFNVEKHTNTETQR